jgi:hypothetical protein
MALIALALAGVLGWQWRDWPPPQPQPSVSDGAGSRTDAVPKPEENPLDLLTPLGAMEEYAVVTERPLFLPDRRPPVDEPEQEAETEPEELTELDGLDLNAVMITPNESSAWVRDPRKKELVRLRLGDDLVGWSVKEILSDRLLLERQGETDALILRDYKNMPPPVPARQRQAARKPPRQAPQAARDAAQRRQVARQPNVRRPNVRRPGASQPAGRIPRTGMNGRQPQQQR